MVDLTFLTLSYIQTYRAFETMCNNIIIMFATLFKNKDDSYHKSEFKQVRPMGIYKYKVKVLLTRK